MIKIIISGILVILCFTTSASSHIIRVKQVPIVIKFNDVPIMQHYKVSNVSLTKNEKDQIIANITTELQKYTAKALNYVPDSIYVCKEILDMHGAIAAKGVAVGKRRIILSKNIVFNKNKLSTLHHEIFHVFFSHFPDVEEKYVNLLHNQTKKYEGCNYGATLVGTDQLFKYGYATAGGRINPEEDLCETFSLLMHTDYSDYRLEWDPILIDWTLEKHREENSYFLVTKVCLVIQFTIDNIDPGMNLAFFTKLLR